MEPLIAGHLGEKKKCPAIRGTNPINLHYNLISNLINFKYLIELIKILLCQKELLII